MWSSLGWHVCYISCSRVLFGGSFFSLSLCFVIMSAMLTEIFPYVFFMSSLNIGAPCVVSGVMFMVARRLYSICESYFSLSSFFFSVFVSYFFTFFTFYLLFFTSLSFSFLLFAKKKKRMHERIPSAWFNLCSCRLEWWR